jgi:RNA-directed DNA polymerase
LKRYGNLYEQIYDFDALYQAYKQARRGKRYRREVLAFTDRLEENLITLQNELIWHTYRQSPYREFYVREPKQRLIMALPFRDRVVQWSIYQTLNPILDRQYIHDSYACRPGKGTHAALGRLVYWLRGIPRANDWYCLKLDVHKYFYRVNHDILVDLYQRIFDDQELIWLLDHIIRSHNGSLGVVDGCQDYSLRTSGVGMAVGNLVSQMSANVYLNELDQFAKHQLRLRHYARYMDDVLVLHPDKAVLHQVRAAMEKFLSSRLALRTNAKTQIRPVSQGLEWVGFRVWPSHTLLRKSSAKRMKRRLKALQRHYAEGRIDVPTVNQSIQSYRGILMHCDSGPLRKSVFENLVFRRDGSSRCTDSSS